MHYKWLLLAVLVFGCKGEKRELPKNWHVQSAPEGVTLKTRFITSKVTIEKTNLFGITDSSLTVYSNSDKTVLKRRDSIWFYESNYFNDIIKYRKVKIFKDGVVIDSTKFHN